MDDIITTVHRLIDVNFQLLLTGGAVILCVLLLGLLLWLAFRPLRLWYWKVGSHARKLEEIEVQISNIGKEIAENCQTKGKNTDKISLEVVIERDEPSCTNEEQVSSSTLPKAEIKQEAKPPEQSVKTEGVIASDFSEVHRLGEQKEAVKPKSVENVEEAAIKSKLYCRENNTSRAGRVYTKIELQNIIKD